MTQHNAAAERAGKQDSGDAATDPAALQAQLDLLRSRYTDEHPDVIHLKALLAQARLNEKKSHPDKPAAAGADTAVSPELLQQRERMASLKTELALTDRELEFRSTERREILAKIAAYQSRLDKLPVREQEMTRLSRDYEIAKANYKSLLDKRIAADMATDLERRQQGERFTMIDPARPPSKPASPDRPSWIALGAGASLLIALIVAFVKEYKKNVLLGEWELPSDIPILGRIGPIMQSPKAAVAPGTPAGS